jgi:hypothetical protein
MTSLSTTSFAGYTFGTWYPTGYIVALTREYTDAVGLQQALQQAGIEDVEVWRADEVYANYTAYRLQRSMMERMIAVLATDERAIQDDNLQAAQEGYTFLTIPVSDPTEFVNGCGSSASPVLRHAHGASTILLACVHLFRTQQPAGVCWQHWCQT